MSRAFLIRSGSEFRPPPCNLFNNGFKKLLIELLKVANCETTARVMREEEARLEEVYNRSDINERNSDLILKQI